MIGREYFGQNKNEPERERSSRGEDGKPRIKSKESLTEIHVISGGPYHGSSIHGGKASLKKIWHQINYNNTS